MTNKTVVLAAGGTGGHLFPAYALAEELARRGVDVDLMTDSRALLYGQDFPARNTYKLPAATISGRSPVNLAKSGFTMLTGLREAHRLMGELRPSVVVGFGGYPSFAPLVAAALRRVPTIVHEQNAVLGRANRLLARRADIIATSFQQVELVPEVARDKITLVGNPVRDDVIRASSHHYFPASTIGEFTLVVFGGSQGARLFSDLMPEALGLLDDQLKKRLRLVQQCRPEDLDRVRLAYDALGISSNLNSFFEDLPQIIARSHLVVARAGASTVAELAVLGRPSILVPLSHSVDNDQLYNATRLADAGGGWFINEAELSAQSMAEYLSYLMMQPQVLSTAAEAAQRLARPDAVKKFADLVVAQMG